MEVGRKKVAFICSANMCRSPMAEAIFTHHAARRNLPAEAISAGTLGIEGFPPVAQALTVCANHGIAVPERSSKAALKIGDQLAECDRVFVMEEEHELFLAEAGLIEPGRVTLLGEFRTDGVAEAEIPDPIGEDDAAFERCFVLLEDCITNYLDRGGDFEA